MAVLYNNQDSSASITALNTIGLKAFRLYRFTFFPFPFGETTFPKITEVIGKKVVYWTVRDGATLRLYVFPLENPIPVAAALIAIGAILGLALTVLVLRELKDISGIAYAAIGLGFLIMLNRLGFRFGKDRRR